jgi:sugar lactone lactonase YvrE
VYADTGGSPQHLVFDHLNQLYAADIAHAAVLHIKEDGGMQIVVRDYEGNPFKGPRSLCFDSGGQLFFTDGGAYGETSLHSPTGGCFVVTGEANSRILRPVALDCLAHPTGVTLNPTESAVYVTEQVREDLRRPRLRECWQ